MPQENAIAPVQQANEPLDLNQDWLEVDPISDNNLIDVLTQIESMNKKSGTSKCN